MSLAGVESVYRRRTGGSCDHRGISATGDASTRERTRKANASRGRGPLAWRGGPEWGQALDDLSTVAEPHRRPVFGIVHLCVGGATRQRHPALAIPRGDRDFGP